MVTNGTVRVVRFFSTYLEDFIMDHTCLQEKIYELKVLVGPQLNWPVREKECYRIFYGVRLFEDLLDNRPFILKTDHMKTLSAR